MSDPYAETRYDTTPLHCIALQSPHCIRIQYSIGTLCRYVGDVYELLKMSLLIIEQLLAQVRRQLQLALMFMIVLSSEIVHRKAF